MNTKPGIEIVSGERPCGPFRAAVFDFDDTLSLLRSGWQQVMLEQALEALSPLTTSETDSDLRAIVLKYIDELTGQPTIHQMGRLAAEVVKRGGVPRSAEQYKDDYLARLNRVIEDRAASIRSGAAPASTMQVLGAEALLKVLRERGLTLILASGTDDEFVQNEMRLLGLAQYFGPHIYGAPAEDPTFSKGRVLDEMIRTLGIPGEAIVGFGDGVVEIRETRRVGGFAVGIVKWSPERPDAFAEHRARLIEAGAQAIVPDYERLDEILALLGI